jgi:WD40 repeat protein
MESFPKGEAWKYPLAFSPDGKLALARRLPAGRTRTTAPLSLWGLSTGREVRVFDFLPEEEPDTHMHPQAAAFTPDGQRILTVGSGGVLRTWGVDGKELRAVPLDPKGALNTFSADAKRLLRVGGSFRVDPWNDPPRNMRDSFKGVPWDVRVIFWDTATGKELLAVKK